MATLNAQGQVQYQGGEALPTVGSDAYKAAQAGVIAPTASYAAPASSQVITPSGLATATPLKLADAVPTTGFTGLAGSIEQATKATQAGMKEADAKAVEDAKIASEQKTVDSQKQALYEKVFGTPSKSSLESDAYAAGNGLGTSVNKSRDELNAINNQILSEQTAARHEIESIQATGGVSEGVNRKVAAIQKDSYSKQADLAVIQQAKQNNYALAKDIADRKVTALLEEDKNKLDAMKFLYSENKDQLTKDEQRQFDAKIKADDRAYAKKESDLKAVADLSIQALKNGAPTSVVTEMQKAKNQAEALSIGGQYVGGLKSPTAPEIKKINGVDVQWNPKTGQWETPSIAKTTQQPTLQLAQSQGNVQSISDLTKDSAITGAVGPNIFARSGGGGLDQLTGAKQNFIASVEQVRSNLNIDALIGAKQRGATFGALSDQELQVLASSASKIGSWAIKDGSGNVVGYNASEKDFKKELDKINNFARLDFIIKGGDPMDVGAQMMNDGSVWTTNSDGTYTQIK